MIWGIALREVLTDFANVEYCWGKHDCIQFVNAFVKLRTGVDHAAKFPYDSERAALKLLARHEGVEGLMMRCLGEPKFPGLDQVFAGDVVVCHSENQHIPGVSNGSFVWLFSERGLGRLTLPTIVSAWGV